MKLKELFLPRVPIFGNIEYSSYIEKYKNEFNINNTIYEGIIKTYPRQDLIAYINAKLKLSTQPDHVEPHNIIVQVLKRQITQLQPLLQIATQFGWYVSLFEYNDNEYKGNEVDQYIEEFSQSTDSTSFITLEPLHSAVLNTPNILYHATLETIWETTISTQGLSPKSKSILSTHPGRVYYTTDIGNGILFAKELAVAKLNAALSKKYNTVKFNPKQYYKKWVLLAIDTTKIPHTRNLSYFRVHLDTNASEGIAVYSQNYVPPGAISIVKRFEAY